MESILRRVDHSGDHCISYDEFCEVTSVNDQNVPFDKIEESSQRSPLKDVLGDSFKKRTKSQMEFDSGEKSIE